MNQSTLLFAAGAAGLLFAGCATTDSSTANEQILVELKALNAKLETLSGKLEENTKAVAKLKTAPAAIGAALPHVPRTGDKEALDKLKLADNPTPDDIRKYIREIQKATEGQNSFAPSDQQVDLYRQIGPGNLEVILPFLRANGIGAYHLQNALDGLVGIEDKELAIKKIKEYPTLAIAFVKNGWVEDAREELLTILEKSDNPPHELARDAAQLVKTDADRKRLIDIFCTRPNQFALLTTIKTFPNTDMREITERAFENFRYTQHWNRQQYATAAANEGSLKALDGLIEMMPEPGDNSNNNSYMRDQIGKALLALTGRPANPTALRKWYDENKEKLVFNKERGRFEVK